MPALFLAMSRLLARAHALAPSGEQSGSLTLERLDMGNNANCPSMDPSETSGPTHEWIGHEGTMDDSVCVLLLLLLIRLLPLPLPPPLLLLPLDTF